MRAPLRPSLLLATSLGGIQALSLFVGCANLGGLTSGGPDAGSDATGEEGVARGDAALDAGDGGVRGPDGQAGSFCALASPAPLFCADFDESPDAAAGWNSVAIELGTLAIDTGAWVSAPGSLSAAIDAFNGGTQPAVGVFETFDALAGVACTLTLDVDFRLDAVDPHSFINAVSIALASPATNQDPYLLIFSIGFDGNGMPTGQLVTYTGSGYTGGPPTDMATTYPLGNIIPLHEWAHVTMTVELPKPASATGNSVLVSMGGATLFEQPFTLTETSPTPGIAIGIGPYVASPSATWNLHYDNVVVRSTLGDSE